MNSFFSSVFITVLLAVVLRFFVIQPFVVEGQSMEPNFHNEQYIMIDKLSYHFRGPARGEVVVFHPPVAPSENYIKRVIGLPGDTIQIANGDVFVNGQQINEPYLQSEQHHTDQLNAKQPVTLQPNQYFVMGDNRENSSDSREWGIVQASEIEGRTWVVVFPINTFHVVSTPSYSIAGTFNVTLPHSLLTLAR